MFNTMFDTYTPTHRAQTDLSVLDTGTDQMVEATDVRDYPDHVCPGQHCRGRRVVHWHRFTTTAVHTLSRAQAARVEGKR